MKCRQIFTSLELAKKHLRITGHHKMTLKAVVEDEAASQEEGVALSDVAPIVDIQTFMKQPFTEINFLDDEQVNTPLSRTVQAGSGPRVGVTQLLRSIKMPKETAGCL